MIPHHFLKISLILKSKALIQNQLCIRNLMFRIESGGG